MEATIKPLDRKEGSQRGRQRLERERVSKEARAFHSTGCSVKDPDAGRKLVETALQITDQKGKYNPEKHG